MNVFKHIESFKFTVGLTNEYIATTQLNTKVQQITLNLRNDAFFALLQLTLLEFKTFLSKVYVIISIFEVGRE